MGLATRVKICLTDLHIADTGNHSAFVSPTGKGGESALSKSHSRKRNSMGTELACTKKSFFTKLAHCLRQDSVRKDRG